MATKPLVSQKTIDQRFWRNVDIQDRFWQCTFVEFVRPLQKIYRDPTSAGSHLLSAYVSDGESAVAQLLLDPEQFGQLNVALRKSTRSVLGDLVLGVNGAALGQCLQEFAEARAASEEIAKFASEFPKVYWELQRNRAARRGQAVKVTFFGKSIEVSKIDRPKKAARRARKIKLPLR